MHLENGGVLPGAERLPTAAINKIIIRTGTRSFLEVAAVPVTVGTRWRVCAREVIAGTDPAEGTGYDPPGQGLASRVCFDGTNLSITSACVCCNPIV